MGKRSRHRFRWMRFGGGPSRPGGASRQGGRKVGPPRRGGGIAIPGVIGQRLDRSGTRLASATIYPDERRSAWIGGEGASFPALPFGSCFAYLPGGRGPVCEEGRLLCTRLKSADPAWLPRLAAQVWLEMVGHGRFAAAFGARVVLVPVPGSAPAGHADWVGERLAWCLREIGLAAEVWPVLRRRHAVRKSAFAAAGERPSVLEHYASFAVERAHPGRALLGPRNLASAPGEAGLQLTLVDDVITRGRTLLAAARKIRESFPGAEIRAFALLRTLGANETLRQVLDPCEGEVCWVHADARRSP